MGNEFWAAIAGAVVGGVITAVVSYLLQQQNLKAAKAAREQEQLERRQGLARSIIYKLGMIYSHAGQLSAMMQGIFAEVARPNKRIRPCQIAQEITPIPAEVHFSTDEVTLLLALNMADHFNDLAITDERHNNLLAIVSDFNARKAAFTDLFVPSGMTGEVGHLEMTKEQENKALPRMLHIDQLLEGMRGQSLALAKDCDKLLTALISKFNEKVALGLRVTTEEFPHRGPKVPADFGSFG